MRITIWQHKACRVMPNCDPECQIFYAILRQLIDSYSCSSLNTAFIYHHYVKVSSSCYVASLHFQELQSHHHAMLHLCIFKK